MHAACGARASVTTGPSLDVSGHGPRREDEQVGGRRCGAACGGWQACSSSSSSPLKYEPSFTCTDGPLWQYLAIPERKRGPVFPDFTFLRSTIRKITFHSFESISCAQTNKCRGMVCAAQRQCSPILCTPWISAVYQRPKVQLAPAASLNRTNTRYMGYRLCGTSEHAASARNRRNCIRLGVNTRRELIAIFDATVE
jgi:hypothetical protein